MLHILSTDSEYCFIEKRYYITRGSIVALEVDLEGRGRGKVPPFFQFQSFWLFQPQPLALALAGSSWPSYLSGGLESPPQPGWPSLSLALSLVGVFHFRLLVSLRDLIVGLCNNGKKKSIWSHLLRPLASCSCKELRHMSIGSASSLSAAPPWKVDTFNSGFNEQYTKGRWGFTNSSAVCWIASFHESHKPSFSLFSDPPIVIRAFLFLT